MYIQPTGNVLIYGDYIDDNDNNKGKEGEREYVCVCVCACVCACDRGRKRKRENICVKKIRNATAYSKNDEKCDHTFGKRRRSGSIAANNLCIPFARRTAAIVPTISHFFLIPFRYGER